MNVTLMRSDLTCGPLVEDVRSGPPWIGSGDHKVLVRALGSAKDKTVEMIEQMTWNLESPIEPHFNITKLPTDQGLALESGKRTISQQRQGIQFY